MIAVLPVLWSVICAAVAESSRGIGRAKAYKVKEALGSNEMRARDGATLGGEILLPKHCSSVSKMLYCTVPKMILVGTANHLLISFRVLREQL